MCPPHQQTGAHPLLTRSNLFSLVALLVVIAAGTYFALYVPRSQGVTTIIIGNQSITWNDVRRICTGIPSGTTTVVSPTLSIKCVR